MTSTSPTFDELSNDELSNQINALTSQKHNLLNQISLIDSELNSAQIQLNFLLNQRLPISHLPSELLEEIFHVAQSIHPPSLKQVSQVSKHWRSVALGTPTLWRVIDIVVPSKYQPSGTHMPRHIADSPSGTNIAFIRASIDRSIAKLTNYLIRSDPCPIDIRLNVTVTHTLERLIEIIKPHAHRWRRLAINVTDAKTKKELRAPLHNVHAPLLEHLSLRIGVWQNDYSGIPRMIRLMEEPDLRKFGSRARILKGRGNGEDGSDVDTKRSSISSLDPADTNGVESESPVQDLGSSEAPLASPAPQLRFVRLSGGALCTLHPPLATVTTLHLEGLPFNADINDPNNPRLMPWSKFRSFFTGLPLLTNLSLNQISINEHSPLKHPLDIPTLRALRICGGRTPLQKILPKLNLPNMEYLTLHDVGDFPLSFANHSNSLTSTTTDTASNSDTITTPSPTSSRSPTSPFPSLRILSLTRCNFNLVQVFSVVRTFREIEVVKIDDCIPDIYRVLGPTVVGANTTPGTTATTTNSTNTSTASASSPSNSSSSFSSSSSSPSTPTAPYSISNSADRLRSPHDGPGWPKLQTMVIASLQPPDVRLFCAMLQNRQDAKMQVKRVILGRRTRQVLKQKNKLEWVRAVIEGSRWLEDTTATGNSGSGWSATGARRLQRKDTLLTSSEPAGGASSSVQDSGAWRSVMDMRATGVLEMELENSVWPNELGYEDLDDIWGDS
ncbi:hypothetical protein AX16_010193 [Volvariella volvacea WC 439]|nr:hypothetical protein AX16_010193 [Volvariella volvacea WC 439]